MCTSRVTSPVLAVDSMYAQTPADGSERDFHHVSMSIVDRSHFIFRVRAASKAYVALSAHLGIVKTNTYEIMIGVESNNATYIRVRDLLPTDFQL